ncbi:MAG TPA: hypothetical protein VKP30_27560 [Polyangiaceae bacterium]|nr:hypothetical protein [Polyangiaceae bacterium]
MTRSYALQTLLVDGVSFATVLLGSALSQPGDNQGLYPGTWLAAAGIGGYVLGAPIVHFSHGNIGRGLGSLGLRAALPIVLTFGGVPVPGHCPYEHSSEDNSNRTWCDTGYVEIWALAVLGPAMALDAALLAWEKVPAEHPTITGSRAPLRIHPTWNWRTGDIGIGISGAL